jgi:hypothetical protein
MEDGNGDGNGNNDGNDDLYCKWQQKQWRWQKNTTTLDGGGWD